MAHVEVIAEYNEKGAMLWADSYPGAYSRGETVSGALEKFPKALSEYAAWAHGAPLPNLAESDFVVTHAYQTELRVDDADSDVLFPSERLPMDMTEYTQKKQLCIRSAQDFENKFGVKISDVFGEVINKNCGLGLLKVDGDKISLTERGMALGNEVFADFLL